MLIDEKISALLASRNTTFEEQITGFIDHISVTGKADAKNLILNEILLDSLTWGFDLPNTNLQLYKWVNSFDSISKNYSKIIKDHNSSLNTTEPIIYTIPSMAVTTITPLDFGTVDIGEESTNQILSVTAENLTDLLTVESSAQFQVSLNPSYGFTSSITFIPTSKGTVITKTIYIKFVPTSNGAATGTITCSSTGATSQVIDVEGIGTGGLLTVVPSSLSFATTNLNVESVEGSYVLAGEGLISNVLVTAPTGFTLSLISGGTFASFIYVPQIVGIIDDVTVYVKFTPTEVASYAGDITHTTNMANTVTVAVDGIGAILTTVVIADKASMTFGPQLVGDLSDPQELNLIITDIAPYGGYDPPKVLISKQNDIFNNFELSILVGGPYTNNILDVSSLISGGNINSSIFIRYTRASTGTPTPNLSIQASKAPTGWEVIYYPTLTGITVFTPDITVPITENLFGGIDVDTIDTISYNLLGVNLQEDVTITAPTGYTVSKDGITYASSVVVAKDISLEIDTTIYIKFSPLLVQDYNGVVYHTSSLAITRTINVTGNGLSVSPSINAVPNSLAFGDVQTSTISAYQVSYLLGANLADPIVVTAPTGFTVCKTFDGVYGATVSYTPTLGIVDEEPLYIQFEPVALIVYDNVVNCDSTGVTTVEIAVTGTGIA